MNRLLLALASLAFLALRLPAADAQADLLIVGGTESGCAAAVQAARMGVKRIVLVNDIDWLGGQFSAEGLGAIDENRAQDYDGRVPIPRSGIFRDVIDAIEAKNAALYGGVRRPGNTRVITTARPVVSEAVFCELLAPFESNGQIIRYSNYEVDSVLTFNKRVGGVRFESSNGEPPLTVYARLTIDASDFGEVIQGSGAKWDVGVDAKSEFDEPSAPESAEPANDLNPITWCMILEQRDQETLIPKPPGYDPRYFSGKWGWIDQEFAYTTRRLVDGQGFKDIDHPDILLINNPNIDYPLDEYPAEVVAELKATEAGAAKKSIVALSRQQREIVFRDAKAHTLKYYYYLQKKFPKFRLMTLSDEFGTADKLPPKPYLRESLRLEAQHIIREQEVLGFNSRSDYATTMFPDAVFSWQFELDFHPTKRSWISDQGTAGPWEADFRGKRRFGRGGTGRAVFPLRALVPKGVNGLLGAQKNLGYTSIVGSSCRLHDQSMHAGQACGAVAAISLRHNENPAEFYLQPERIAEIWNGLLDAESGVPLAIWPFSDVDPLQPGFVAIQQLALRRVLNLGPSDTAFGPNDLATKEWLRELEAAISSAGYEAPPFERMRPATRLTVAIATWNHLKTQSPPKPNRSSKTDADDDGILDDLDPLPFTPGVVSWQPDPLRDGLPDQTANTLGGDQVVAINFTSSNGPVADGFKNDIGAAFSNASGFGWKRNLRANTRLRGIDDRSLRDGFVFTRERDIWEYRVANGRWQVHVCLGDAGHEQPGQNLQIEDTIAASNIETRAGGFYEVQAEVQVSDGKLTLTLGKPEAGSNTCINWIVVVPVDAIQGAN
jgi:hypothetical protein